MLEQEVELPADAAVVGVKRHQNDKADFREIVGHGLFLWVRVSSSLLFGKTLPARRIPARWGKGVRSARPEAGPLRRRAAMRQPFPPLPSVHSLLAVSSLLSLSPVPASRRLPSRWRGQAGAVGRQPKAGLNSQALYAIVIQRMGIT